MRVVIIGQSGQLGSDLMTAFAEDEPIGVDHRLVDIEVPSSIAAMMARLHPDVLINTAAFHNVELCEARPDRAFAVNTLAVDSLAAQCAASRTTLVHISTDYVFDGTAGTPYAEDASPNPLSSYGISKYAGELMIGRHLGEAYVIRTSGLYGLRGSSTKGYTFIERILEQAEHRAPIRVVTDVTSSPSYTRHVAEGIRNIVETQRYGTYHVVNAGFCTWYDFATEALRQAGFDNEITATTSAAFSTSVRRPAFSALSTSAASAVGLKTMPMWQEGIREYLSERRKQRAMSA